MIIIWGTEVYFDGEEYGSTALNMYRGIKHAYAHMCYPLLVSFHVAFLLYFVDIENIKQYNMCQCYLTKIPSLWLKLTYFIQPFQCVSILVSLAIL